MTTAVPHRSPSAYTAPRLAIPKPAKAARLRALADDLAACGAVQTAAVCRAMADEAEAREVPEP